MSRLLSSLPVGALVKDPNFVYKGTVPIFRILEHGHTGDPVGSTTIECRDIICIKPYDGKESNNPTSMIKTWGNDRYLYSNLLQWMNSDVLSNWYVSQHTYDAPPNAQNTVTQYLQTPNPYDEEPGFLTFFPAGFKRSLLTTTKQVLVSGSSKENVPSKIFLLSTEEYNTTHADGCGTAYEYYQTDNIQKLKKNFASDAAKIPYPTLTNPGTYYTRTRSSDGMIWGIGDGGYPQYGQGACSPSMGISPALCISSNTGVSDNPDSDGAYTFVWNQEPTISPASTNYGNVTAPPSITTTITDPDGDSFTYTVKLNGTTKTSGSGTGTKTFAIDTTGYWSQMALGSNTITVQVTDSQGATASATYTMNKTNSAAPVPTTDLVNNTRKETSFYIGFQIGLDADGDSQTVVAQVSSSSSMSNPTEFSGVEKEVAGAWLPVQTLTNADVGARLRIQVTGQTVGNTIYVRLKDTDSGSGTPVYTSTYAIVIGSVLEFNTLPIVRTEKPSLVVAYLNKTKPADATLAMYACNNANDGAPTWEPITEGETHQFTNKTKTAQNWAVSVKTSITAGATAGEISVSAVGLGVL